MNLTDQLALQVQIRRGVVIMRQTNLGIDASRSQSCAAPR